MINFNDKRQFGKAQTLHRDPQPLGERYVGTVSSRLASRLTNSIAEIAESSPSEIQPIEFYDNYTNDLPASVCM